MHKNASECSLWNNDKKGEATTVFYKQIHLVPSTGFVNFLHNSLTDLAAEAEEKKKKEINL